MNNRLGKTKLNSLSIILYSKEISSIILGYHTQKFWKKNTKQVRWSTQGGDLNTNYTNKVEILLPDIYATKTVTWNFHINDSQGRHRKDMKLGCDIFWIKHRLMFLQ